MVFFVICLISSFIFIGSFIAIQFYNNSTYNGSIKQENLSNSTLYANSTTTLSTDALNNIICVKQSYLYLRSWFIIVGSIILLLNGNFITYFLAFYCLFMACVDYASDQEWSRYLLINTIMWCALVGFLIGNYLSVLN